MRINVKAIGMGIRRGLVKSMTNNAIMSNLDEIADGFIKFAREQKFEFV
jgi:hypothetical protein